MPINTYYHGTRSTDSTKYRVKCEMCNGVSRGRDVRYDRRAPVINLGSARVHCMATWIHQVILPRATPPHTRAASGEERDPARAAQHGHDGTDGAPDRRDAHAGETPLSVKMLRHDVEIEIDQNPLGILAAHPRHESIH